MKQIFLHEPYFFNDEIKNLRQCIKSGWVSTGGKFVSDFEKKLSTFTKTNHAVALNSGTSALDLSLKSLSLNEGDEIIVPTITFIAPINVVIYNRCKPIFMDTDNFGNLDVSKLGEFLENNTFKRGKHTINKSTKNIIKAVIVVHVFGNLADVINIKKICKKKNIVVIEDASESLGSYYKYNTKLLHSGSIGDIGCISFNANKIITTGSGGSIITNIKKVSKRVNYLSTQAKNDSVRFIHDEIGYNMKLNNISAAIGISQLKSLNTILKKKQRIFNFYKKKINSLKNFEIINPPKYSKSNNWIILLRIKNDKFKLARILNKFLEQKIQVRPVWYPNHLQKKMVKFQRYKLKNYKNFIDRVLCLPSGHNLNKKQLNRVVIFLKNIDKHEKY